MKFSGIRFSFFFIWVIISLNTSVAQDKKATGLFERGEEVFRKRDYPAAKKFYEEALSRHPDYPLVLYRLGQIAYLSRDLTAAKKYYERLLELDPSNKSYVLAFTFLGGEYMKEARFEKASEYLQLAMQNTRNGTPAYQQLENQLATCEFAKVTMSNPLVINPQEMSPVLNFKDRQYFPAFTADGEAIYFTSRNNGGDEDIYVSRREMNGWSEPKGISDVINTPYNEGACTISADGNTMVFTGCEGRERVGGCDLFISYKKDGNWSTPVNMGKNVNSPDWDSQASLSSDGRTLIFSSDRFGGEGNKDLYVTTMDGKGNWTLARNLGKVINTRYDEVSPFLHANGSSLFFASNGHISLGGFDIFLAEKRKEGFEKPLNLGYPVNDVNDQFGMVISADGKEAYYSLEKGDKVKLYSFELPKELKEKFDPTFFVKGMVKDSKTEKPLQARLQLINLQNKEVLSHFETDSSTGEYMAVLPHSGNYGLYIERPDYFFKSLNFSFDDKENRVNKKLDIVLDRIDKQHIEVLNTIYFDEASWEIKQESEVELSKLAKMIWDNPSLGVEILAHTDDVGKDADNLVLSQKRAESVVNYLIREGVNSNKLRSRGFGESKPVVPNTSDENRKMNRRIEFRFF
jgi:outer membrane protein OmpA-like peptidoglycan-associated protein/Tfp pilus assembly protein PilF